MFEWLGGPNCRWDMAVHRLFGVVLIFFMKWQQWHIFVAWVLLQPHPDYFLFSSLLIQVDQNFMLYLPRLAVLVTIVAD